MAAHQLNHILHMIIVYYAWWAEHTKRLGLLNYRCFPKLFGESFLNDQARLHFF